MHHLESHTRDTVLRTLFTVCRSVRIPGQSAVGSAARGFTTVLTFASLFTRLHDKLLDAESWLVVDLDATRTGYMRESTTATAQSGVEMSGHSFSLRLIRVTGSRTCA